MSTINLTNNTSLNVTAGSADNEATLNRYLQHPLEFLTPSGLKGIADTQMKDLDDSTFPFTASATGTGNFAVEGTSLGVKLGATANVNVLTGASAASLCSSLSLPANPPIAAFVSFGLQSNVGVGPTATVGDFCFGITDGAKIQLTSFFAAANTDKFKDALGRAISGFTIPHDIDDLKSLREGCICQIDASSCLKFTASVTYSILNDPLATGSVSKLPSFAVNASAGATIEATASHTSDHTITIAKLANGLIHLSVSLTKSDDFESSLTVSAGATAMIGGQDALAFLLGKISPDSKQEVATLKGELSPAQARKLSGDIKAAIDAALCSSLQASLKTALDVNQSKNRIFLYQIDLNALDAAGTTALQSALAGDFTKITGTVLAGVKELDSALTTTKTVTHSLTLHLLGIFNYGSTNTFIENSTVDYTQDTHEIVLSDEKIKVVGNNLDSEKLRQVVLKGVTLTLPAAANTQDAGASINMVFFDRQAGTGLSLLRQYGNVLRVKGASDSANADAWIARNLKNYGTASLYLCLTLTAAQSRQVFIDKTGQARDWMTFVGYACDALKIILSGDGSSVNQDRLKLCNADQSLWTEIGKDGAAPNVERSVAKLGVQQDNVPVVASDAITFLWWAQAMAAYAQALQANQSLENPGAEVVKDAARGFDEPWMILATWNILENPAMLSIFTCEPPAVAIGAVS